jgi:protein-S-isoprenylcysteine O-methyltransferase Ste14
MPWGIRVAEWSWLIFFIYWLIAAIGTKRTQRRETTFSRARYVVLTFAAFVFMFTRNWTLGWLDRQWIQASPALAIAGLILVFAGLGFAVWARIHIGRNWSGVVTVKVEHQLIRTGPYAHIRHPIYSGLIVAMIGTALETRQIRGALAPVVLYLGFLAKSRIEERFMEQTFGSAYNEYRKSSGAFLPRVSNQPPS